MAKPPTDYVLFFLGLSQGRSGARELTVHKKHILASRLDLTKRYQEDYNGNTYHFNRNRAFKLKGWIPWKMWDQKRPFKSLLEMLRKKRIAALIYLEPSAKELMSSKEGDNV